MTSQFIKSLNDLLGYENHIIKWLKTHYLFRRSAHIKGVGYLNLWFEDLKGDAEQYANFVKLVGPEHTRFYETSRFWYAIEEAKFQFCTNAVIRDLLVLEAFLSGSWKNTASTVSETPVANVGNPNSPIASAFHSLNLEKCVAFLLATSNSVVVQKSEEEWLEAWIHFERFVNSRAMAIEVQSELDKDLENPLLRWKCQAAGNQAETGYDSELVLMVIRNLILIMSNN